MKNFDVYLENGDVCAFSFMTGEVSGDEIMRKLASEDDDIPVEEKDYWEFQFEGYDVDTEEIGEFERFGIAGHIDVKNIVTNDDGSRSLLLKLDVWENKRMFKNHKTEYAIRVPMSIRYVPGVDNSWDIQGSAVEALKLAEAKRNEQERSLLYDDLGNGCTLLTAIDKTHIEVPTPVAQRVRVLINDIGIRVVSLDIDQIICAHGEISYLNLHINNPEVLDTEEFKSKSSAITTYCDKYDWDVWFVRPGHARNEFIESLTAL